MIARRIAPVLFIVLLLAANAQARTLFVNGGAPQPGDGSSWAAPLKEVNEALKLAADGDDVWVAAGVYTPGGDRTATFRLVPGVSLYGGFAGNETELRRRDPEAHQTVLSGDIGQPGVPDDNVYHVVTGADRAVLDGFTVSGGYSLNAPWHGQKTVTATGAAGGPGDGQGAGMLNFRAAPTVRDCVFQDNHALEGGAVYNMTSADPAAPPNDAPRFLNCAFWQNSALAWGGGVANVLRARPLFVSCQFDSNLSDGKGGGMYNGLGAAPILFNSLFRNNEAQHGAGLANEGNSSAVLYYCTLTGNRALGDGPAIHQQGGQNLTVLLKTVVWDNEAPEGDVRFLSEPPSAIRVQAAVIQGGYDGKDVFRSNPRLDRKSETMLNNGYKTNGYQFVDDQLPARYADMARYGLTDDLPAFDPAYAATVPEALLKVRETPVRTAETPAPPPAPTPEAVIASIPEPPAEAIAPPAPTPAEPVAAPAPEATRQAAPEPAPAAVATAEPESISVPEAAPASVATAAPTPVTEAPEPPPATPEPAPEALAMAVPSEPATTPVPAGPEPPAARDSMAALDLDGNGCVTVNEADGLVRQQFWQVDHNGDGCVSKIELDRFEAKQGKKAVKPAAPVTRTAQPASGAVPTPPARQAAVRPPTAVSAAAPTASSAAAPAAATSTPGAGYTLFAPVGDTRTYLVDGSGRSVKTWEGRDPSTGTVYLLPNGNLLRTVSPAKGEVRTPFEGEDVSGGIIQEVSPRGQIVWEYSYVSKDVRQHHDIEPLPNGNVLILAWELKRGSELDGAGASVRNHPDGTIWAEHIVEVRKSGPRSGQIVWEWHAWDHLVQNADSNAPNYANPVRLPQRMDVNYNPGRKPDWLHADSIDYNPALDQIVLSLRNTGEIWIIDHSTSTEQAATTSGGIMHRGGDILFRWGNPAAYGAAGRAELINQHDARWVDHGKPGSETILIFNNADRRTKRSDILEIKPQYYLKATTLSAETVWSYDGQGGEPFFAETGSGAQRLPGGNTLVCDGPGGRIFEVTPQGRAVWEHDGAGKSLYRATRIPADHPALARLVPAN